MPDSPQLLSILFEYRVIPHPRPLPATLRGWTLGRHMAPEGFQHLQRQAPQPLEPGPFGQGPQHPRGPMRVPTPHAADLRGGPTAKEGRKHHADDLTQELVLAP
jgi:hypothetical protein